MTPIYKDVLPGRHPAVAVRRHPLVEDGAAPLERDPTRRLQNERQALRRLEEMNDDVQRVDRLHVKELKEADRNPAPGAVAIIAVVTPTGESDGIDAMSVGLLGEKEERVLATARWTQALPATLNLARDRIDAASGA